MASSFGRSIYFGEMPDVFRRTPSPPPQQPLSPIAQSDISTTPLEVEKGHQQDTSQRDPQATTHEIHDNQRQTDAGLLMNVALSQDCHSKHIEGDENSEDQPTHTCEQEPAVKGVEDNDRVCTTSPSVSTDVENANPNKTESAFHSDGKFNTQSEDIDDTLNELNDHTKTNVIEQGGKFRSTSPTNHCDTLIDQESGSATTYEPITESQISPVSSTTIEHKSLEKPTKQATKCPACSIIPRKTLDGEEELWVECHGCKKWYHLACIGLTEEKVAAIDKFSCPKCWYSCGPTTCKSFQ